jgi:CHASE3 domain sensor protein
MLLFLESLVSDFKTTESLHRRYLLARINSDLTVYRQAGLKLQQALRQILAVRAANGDLKDWRTLESAMSGRIQLMERAMDVGQNSGAEAAAVLVGNELNRKLDDKIAALVLLARSWPRVQPGSTKAGKVQLPRLRSPLRPSHHRRPQLKPLPAPP